MHELVMSALNSEGFRPLVRAIKEGYPDLAEALLIESERDHGAHEYEYSTDENTAIRLAFDECSKRIDRIRREAME